MLLEAATSECTCIAVKLFEYLEDERVRERLRTWRKEDAPDIVDDDFERTRIEANKLIRDKIDTEIWHWEKETGYVKKALEQFTNLITNRRQILYSQDDEIKSILRGDICADLSGMSCE